MKFSLIIVALIGCSSIQSQNITLDSLANIIVKAHSNLGVESLFLVKTDTNSLTLDIKSISKTTVSQIEESFVFDLSNVSDVFSIPMGASEFRVIVGLKEKILITNKTIEFENLFHQEITKEDIREEENLWFVFTEESQSEKFEKTILQLKKQLTQQ
ncbi:MAG: hypothetical protein JKX68_06580 [Flavobacteriales bacterium]|nr:hypothetical protein [Flavobacteriales bacterium]